MRQRTWSIALYGDEAETLEKLFSGFTRSEVLRAALDLLLGVGLVRRIEPKTLSVVFGLRSSAKNLGIPVPFCERVVIDLRGGKVWCQ